MEFSASDNLAAFHAALAHIRDRGRTVALVPTMGALHAGHLALVELARQHADAVVGYIFVNPRQFGPQEDFARYPRQRERDLDMFRQAGAMHCYAPTVEDVYPPGYCTEVQVRGLGDMLEGVHRPGFFSGVATVLAKMFIRARPDCAVFGEKDYQQLCVVRRMAQDLDLPVRIIGAPTVREADGLAMSSRNAYLSTSERENASMYGVLQSAAERMRHRPVAEALEWGKQALLAKRFARVDYFALCDAQTLAPLEELRAPARLLAAAWMGKTRLIDNIGVE